MAPELTATVEGTVTDAKGAAVDATTVEIRDSLEVLEITRTDKTGHFELLVSVRAGQYTLVAIAGGAVVAQATVMIPSVNGNTAIMQNLRVRPKPAPSQRPAGRTPASRKPAAPPPKPPAS